DQRAWLTAQRATLLTPHWGHARQVPGFVAMLASRPRLPEIIPGYAAYLWLDADAWAQESVAVEHYRTQALTQGFAVTPETPPTYNSGELAGAHRRIRGWFGAEVQAKLEGTAPINLGVFAGKAGAPHWTLWRKRVDDWLAASTSRDQDFNADQTAF